MPNFDRFTTPARRAIMAAEEEARDLNHEHIDTEHLLLGLLNEGKGVGALTLQSLSISAETVRELVQNFKSQPDQTLGQHIPFTSQAKKVLELSLREALQLGHNYIGTEHILLALIRDSGVCATCGTTSGGVAQVLESLAVEPSRVRKQVLDLLSSAFESRRTAL